MNHEQQFMDIISQMKAAGMTDGMIKNFIGRVDDASRQNIQAMKPSQEDGIRISQSEPDAVGVYIDADQISQDMYANALMHGANVAPKVTSPFGGPPRATDLSVGVMAAGNPNYTVSEPTRTTVNSQGQIVIY